MKPTHVFFIQPRLPQKLQKLQTLAFNLYWNQDLETRALFRKLDPVLWEESGENAYSLLYRIEEGNLINAAEDPEYLRQLERVWQEYQAYQNARLEWKGPQSHAGNPVIAFFSAEFGIKETLPIYAGGLGLLAGDYLKSAGDLGLPLVGVGLLYRKGYFRQAIDNHGWQRELYPHYDLRDFPLELIREPDGTPLTIQVELSDRPVRVQIWRAQVGRLQLYLLDTYHPDNKSDDRNITDRLYGGDLEKRIQQEIVLGIGGIRALLKLGVEPTICHLNEGHSAFLALERIYYLQQKYQLDFDEARELAASGHIFTTHTPVNAGIDIFPQYLMDKYFTRFYQALNISRRQFMELGQLNPKDPQEAFNMAVLALRLSDWANGVSRLHGETARRMWRDCWPELPEAEAPIGAITNGVHVTSWVGEKIGALYDLYLGSGWRTNPAGPVNWSGIEQVPAKELWQAHTEERFELISFVRGRWAAQLKKWGANPEEICSAANIFDPGVLTIGFARRFATYKRPTLIFHDLNRLRRLLEDEKRPIQIIFAGKAHPEDEEGKKLIQQIVRFARQPESSFRVVFLEDYDIQMARYLVHGVDLWLGNPRRPLEASSTSGMKAVLNGALHLSTLDGWWAEAYTPETGWAIGNDKIHGDTGLQDQLDAESLYYLLEKEIIPLFYDCDSEGLPLGWIVKMKKSIQAYAPVFNTHRMVEEYSRKYYLPAMADFERLRSENLEQLKELMAWKRRIQANWSQVEISKTVDGSRGNKLEVGEELLLQAAVNLGNLKPEDVRVEIYYGMIDNEGSIIEGEKIILNSHQGQGEGIYLYQGAIPCRQSGRYGYNVRVYPYHPYSVNPGQPKEMVVWG
ncbi:MAG: alpha-glucan family phosphorylase [Firmicutes bacterium]|nr:alpha-glucan family phosphorylase [Bacillota bacterium]